MPETWMGTRVPGFDHILGCRVGLVRASPSRSKFSEASQARRPCRVSAETLWSMRRAGGPGQPREPQTHVPPRRAPARGGRKVDYLRPVLLFVSQSNLPPVSSMQLRPQNQAFIEHYKKEKNTFLPPIQATRAMGKFYSELSCYSD